MHCMWYPSMPCTGECAIPACLVAGGFAPGGVPGLGGLLWGVPGGDPLPPDGHCCGRYASYRNAFLF